MKAMKLNFYRVFTKGKLPVHPSGLSFEIMTNGRKITNSLIPHIGHPTLILPMTKNTDTVIRAEAEDRVLEKRYVA
jgi:hypothetical protein